MAISITIQGLKETNNFLARLPKNVTNEIELAGDEFSKFVQKSAKLRAPRITGALANSIVITHPKKNQIEINVNSPYAIFQEEGFKPHFVSVYAPTRNGLRFGEIYGLTSGKAFVSKFTPFIKPALSQGLVQLPNLIQRHLDKAIKQSEVK